MNKPPGNSFLADDNDCGDINLREGYVMLPQLIAQLLRFTRVSIRKSCGVHAWARRDRFFVVTP
jgi:hypothetical protein